MKAEQKNDASWSVFILPLAIISFIALAIWGLSFAWTTKAGFKDPNNRAMYIKGTVLKNFVPAEKLSGSSYIEVLTEGNDVATVYFENSNNGCASDAVTKDGVAATIGSKVVAFGNPVGARQVEVCSSDYFYIKNLGTMSPYSSWLLYVDKRAGLEFKYPPTWKISTSTGSIGTITKVLSASSTDTALEMTVFSGAGSFELAEWVQQFYGASASAPQSTTIANAPAIVVTVTESGSTRNALLFKNNDQMVQFVFPVPETTKDKNLVAIPALILKSLEFVNAASTATTSKGIDSGVYGTVTIGPTCPVQQNPPADACVNKPFKATLKIVDQNGAVASHFSTNDDGSFKVSLQPGVYRIENGSDAMLPRLTPTEIVIKPHELTKAMLTFDSGIR